ncbi:MAG: hypothetical protein JW822_11585 [Spirochaetales bacterium]|nr:hypothetical protein [Spirochaetales bacterium]
MFILAAVYVGAVEKISIAVMELKVTNLPQDEISLLIDFFNNSLFETGVFDVIQSDKRDQLLKEIEFSGSDVADQQKTKEIGKLLSAKLLVFGSVGKLGSNVIFNISVVDVETANIVSSHSKTYKKLEEIVNDLQKISDNVAFAAIRTMFIKKAKIIYHDNFTNKLWVQSKILFYKEGKYHIYNKDTYWFVWDTTTIDDFAMEVEAQWIEGEKEAGSGVLFRLQDEHNYYIFDITKTGYFEVGKVVDGSYYEIKPWEKSTSINVSGVNYLKVVAVGKHMSFFVNNIKVAELFDSTFIKGFFGMFAGKGVHVAFDNLLVYQGNLLLYEDFSRVTENFADTTQAYFKDGEYIVKAGESDYYSWGEVEYENFSFRSEARWSAGPVDSGYGLVSRFKDIDNHYLFIILKSGYYRFGYYKNGEWNVLIDWKKTRIINPEGKNILRIMSMGSTHLLYINDNLVDECEDDTFMSGRIGLFCAAEITAVFDNVEIFDLD